MEKREREVGVSDPYVEVGQWKLPVDADGNVDPAAIFAANGDVVLRSLQKIMEKRGDEVAEKAPPPSAQPPYAGTLPPDPRWRWAEPTPQAPAVKPASLQPILDLWTALSWGFALEDTIKTFRAWNPKARVKWDIVSSSLKTQTSVRLIYWVEGLKDDAGKQVGEFVMLVPIDHLAPNDRLSAKHAISHFQPMMARLWRP
jgi:hypothetical protein